jgi:hypothetical protein
MMSRNRGDNFKEKEMGHGGTLHCENPRAPSIEEDASPSDSNETNSLCSLSVMKLIAQPPET